MAVKEGAPVMKGHMSVMARDVLVLGKRGPVVVGQGKATSGGGKTNKILAGARCRPPRRVPWTPAGMITQGGNDGLERSREEGCLDSAGVTGRIQSGDIDW